MILFSNSSRLGKFLSIRINSLEQFETFLICLMVRNTHQNERAGKISHTSIETTHLCMFFKVCLAKV